MHTVFFIDFLSRKLACNMFYQKVPKRLFRLMTLFCKEENCPLRRSVCYHDNKYEVEEVEVGRSQDS